MLSVSSVHHPYQFLNVWSRLYETWYVYHANWAHLSYVTNPSQQSVFLSLLSLQINGSVKCNPLFSAKQRLSKLVSAATNIRNNISGVCSVVSFGMRVVSKKSLWACLCIPLWFLGNNSVKTFPRQWRVVEGVVFYEVHVISKESSPQNFLYCAFHRVIRSVRDEGKFVTEIVSTLTETSLQKWWQDEARPSCMSLRYAWWLFLSQREGGVGGVSWPSCVYLTGRKVVYAGGSSLK
jgi:hypothetical protein